MTSALLSVLALYLAVVAGLGIAAAAGLPCQPALRTGVLVAQALLLVQVVLDATSLVRGHRPAEPYTHLGYALVSVILFPVLVRRPDGEPSRGDDLVVAVAALAALVVCVRLHATWQV